MLRLRHAIERASRRRWLGLLVVCCLALMLVVLILHTLDHGLLGEAVVTCLAVVLAASAFVLVRRPAADCARRLRGPRGPPRLLAVTVARTAGFRPGSDPPRL